MQSINYIVRTFGKMKKIKILREEYIDDTLNDIIKVFKDKGYEITYDQAHCLAEDHHWCFMGDINFEMFSEDWKEA